MAFTVKDWKDLPDTTTPISASALEDMENRLSNYTDTAGGLTGTPSTSDDNLITAQNATTRPVTLRGAAAQSAEFFRVETSTSAPLLTIDEFGATRLRSVNDFGQRYTCRINPTLIPRWS